MLPHLIIMMFHDILRCRSAVPRNILQRRAGREPLRPAVWLSLTVEARPQLAANLKLDNCEACDRYGGRRGDGELELELQGRRLSLHRTAIPGRCTFWAVDGRGGALSHAAPPVPSLILTFTKLRPTRPHQSRSRCLADIVAACGMAAASLLSFGVSTH